MPILITMKKKTNNFQLFKRECEKWIKTFGLNGYDIEIVHGKSDDFDGPYAEVQSDYNATITWQDYKEHPCNSQNIKDGARHEVVHVLVGRLSCAAYKRWVTKAEVYEAEEELVRKLCKLI